jgi:predicted short-subunit dehydrogenase-like oxidoreductase (DUF2520 family)
VPEPRAAFFDLQPGSFGYDLQVNALESLKRQIAEARRSHAPRDAVGHREWLP